MKYVVLLAGASVCALLIGVGGCSDNDGGPASGGTAGSTGPGGTGGAAGSGGSGGNGGSAGSAGSAGTAGSGGSGGSSGSGTGGSGGSSGDPCSACLGQKCGSQVSACTGNADCKAIYDCVIVAICGEIPEPLVCIDDCSTDHQAGRPTFDPLIPCITDTCQQECSGS